MIRSAVYILTRLISLLVIGAVGALALLYYFGQDLPNYQQLVDYEPPVVTRLYAGDGRLFAEYAIEHRAFVPINTVPNRLINAFLVAEDKNFFSHPGIDVRGIIRAFFQNLRSIGQGKPLIGASTITQQVARNFFLTREQKLKRKIKEAILSLRIEGILSKERILELYLNQIYLGMRSYGVAAAALNYFNKSLEELTIAECAYLAALPKAPRHYHPVKQKERALQRRNWVISRLQEEGLISADESQAAKKEPLNYRRFKIKHVAKADYFAEDVRRQLVHLYGEEALYKGGLVVKTTLHPALQKIMDQSLRKGLIDYDRRHGWRGPLAHIESALLSDTSAWKAELEKVMPPAKMPGWSIAVVESLMPDKVSILFRDGTRGMILIDALRWARRCLENQTLGPAIRTPKDVLAVGDVILVEPYKEKDFTTGRAAKRDLLNLYHLRQIPNINGAMVALDPHTGRVLAMAGGLSYEMSQFNRATQALRQPGSTFKPFVYLAALDKGYAPNSIILDSPIAIDLGPLLGVWRPNNLTEDFLGPITLRTAVEKSRNTATIRLAHEIGIKPIAELAKMFGILDRPPHQYAIALGAGETTLLKMTKAYAMLTNGGKKIEPTLIDRIQDRHGRILYKHDKRTCTECHVPWAHLHDDLLPPPLEDGREQVISKDTAYQMVSILEGAVLRGSGWRARAIGKHIAGKTGSTNDYKDAWFIGFSPDLVVGVIVGFDEPRTLGELETGSRAALPIFVDFMKKALKDTPSIPFRIPNGIRFVRINRETGQRAGLREKKAIFEALKVSDEPKKIGGHYDTSPSTLTPSAGQGIY